MIYSLLGSVSTFENDWGGGGTPHHLHLLYAAKVYYPGNEYFTIVTSVRVARRDKIVVLFPWTLGARDVI